MKQLLEYLEKKFKEYRANHSKECDEGFQACIEEIKKFEKKENEWESEYDVEW